MVLVDSFSSFAASSFPNDRNLIDAAYVNLDLEICLQITSVFLRFDLSLHNSNDITGQTPLYVDSNTTWSVIVFLCTSYNWFT